MDNQGNGDEEQLVKMDTLAGGLKRPDGMGQHPQSVTRGWHVWAALFKGTRRDGKALGCRGPVLMPPGTTLVRPLPGKQSNSSPLRTWH